MMSSKRVADIVSTQESRLRIADIPMTYRLHFLTSRQFSWTRSIQTTSLFFYSSYTEYAHSDKTIKSKTAAERHLRGMIEMHGDDVCDTAFAVLYKGSSD